MYCLQRDTDCLPSRRCSDPCAAAWRTSPRSGPSKRARPTPALVVFRYALAQVAATPQTSGPGPAAPPHDPREARRLLRRSREHAGGGAGGRGAVAPRRVHRHRLLQGLRPRTPGGARDGLRPPVRQERRDHAGAGLGRAGLGIARRTRPDRRPVRRHAPARLLVAALEVRASEAARFAGAASDPTSLGISKLSSDSTSTRPASQRGALLAFHRPVAA